MKRAFRLLELMIEADSRQILRRNPGAFLRQVGNLLRIRDIPACAAGVLPDSAENEAETRPMRLLPSSPKLKCKADNNQT
jgi:hypothetical protein